MIQQGEEMESNNEYIKRKISEVTVEQMENALDMLPTFDSVEKHSCKVVPTFECIDNSNCKYKTPHSIEEDWCGENYEGYCTSPEAQKQAIIDLMNLNVEPMRKAGLIK